MTSWVCGEEDGEQEKLAGVLARVLPRALLLPKRVGAADGVGLGAVIEAGAGPRGHVERRVGARRLIFKLWTALFSRALVLKRSICFSLQLTPDPTVGLTFEKSSM